MTIHDRNVHLTVPNGKNYYFRVETNLTRPPTLLKIPYFYYYFYNYQKNKKQIIYEMEKKE